MTTGLNDLAVRVATALTRAHPQFAASLQVLDQGDVELHVKAPAEGMNAYVHAWTVDGNERRGTGWKQLVRITLSDAYAPSIPSVCPVEISGGSLIVGATSHNNVLPLPFSAAEPVHLRLQVTSGDVLTFAGTAIDIAPSGSAQYIEELPPELWPGHSE